MTGRSKLSLINISVVLVVNIVLNALFIPKYGMIGAALATASAIILMNIIMLVEVILLFKFHPYRLDFFKPFVAGCLSLAVLIFSGRQIFPSHSVFELVVLILIFLGSYFGFILLMGISVEDRYVLEKIRNRISYKSRIV